MPDANGVCRACKKPMIWAKMPSGRSNPLNVEEVAEFAKLDGDKLAPLPGITAYNRVSGNGMPITYSNIDAAVLWAESEHVTFHTSHFSDCPERQKFKRPAPAS
jgi:hypothetical protein